MGTHADWERAKLLRDSAAYMLAKAYIAGKRTETDRLAGKFLAGESEMKKLERELDGRDPE